MRRSAPSPASVGQVSIGKRLAFHGCMGRSRTCASNSTDNSPRLSGGSLRQPPTIGKSAIIISVPSMPKLCANQNRALSSFAFLGAIQMIGCSTAAAAVRNASTVSISQSHLSSQGECRSSQATRSLGEQSIGPQSRYSKSEMTLSELARARSSCFSVPPAEALKRMCVRLRSNPPTGCLDRRNGASACVRRDRRDAPPRQQTSSRAPS